VFTYWAALLDPRTKWVTVCLFLEDEGMLIWCNIRKALLSCWRTINAVPAECLKRESLAAQPQKKGEDRHLSFSIIGRRANQ
jgi:hypothetical protein